MKNAIHLTLPRAVFPLLAGAALCAACQEPFDKRLEREARDFTEKHCPSEPEPGTRLDSATYTPARREYALWYTLSPDNERTLRDNSTLMRYHLRESVSGNVAYKELKKQGITFRFVYRSAASGRTLYDTRITKSDYR